MKKKLTSDDKNIWRLITKKIIPMDAGRSVFPDHNDDFADMLGGTIKQPLKIEKPTRMVASTIKKAPETNAQDVDKRTLSRLKRGQITIDYTLDLHGYNLSDARTLLLSTLKNIHARGGRCLLLIHGKGSITGVAKIKKTFPQWLDDIPSIVLSHAPAKPQHGGTGATYVLLRRKRV